MGTKTKTNSNKSSVNNKALKELIARVDSFEQAMLHTILRSEAMINVLLKSNVVNEEDFKEEITRLFEESQAELMSNNQKVVDRPFVPPPTVED
jgi:ATP-dependent 26S proteasome regulatory subunit